MYFFGKRGGHLWVKGFHNGVADQDGAASGIDPGGKGKKVCGLQFFQASGVCGHGGVGVGVVAIARKMLQNTAHLVCGHHGYHGGNDIRGGLRILPKGTVIHEGIFVSGDITDRS